MPKLSVTREASASIPTEHGTFQLAYFSNSADQKEHLAFTMGDLASQDAVLVRVHSECFTGDVMGSRRCDCGEQLDQALAMVAQGGRSGALSATGRSGHRSAGKDEGIQPAGRRIRHR